MKSKTVLQQKEIPKPFITPETVFIIHILNPFGKRKNALYCKPWFIRITPRNFKISSEAPVGKAMIGKKVGDIVEVKTETGDIIEYEVLEIK